MSARTAERGRALLRRPGAWLSQERDGTYAVRLGPDRRARVALRLAEAEVDALIRDPGLKPRPRGGGWTLRAGGSGGVERPAPGRPGRIAGERTIMLPDGREARVAANLGESPIVWLARRRDAAGRPWLTPAEIAAGERLRLDAERALKGPSVTMRWDALPRAGSGGAARIEPCDAAHAAGRRVEAALAHCGPRLRPILETVCVRQTALQLAEQRLGLRRRQGKTLLKQALGALAEHYGIG